MSIRLNKALAQAGIGARRKVETLIFDGVVTVNGDVCTLPQFKVNPLSDSICVNGIPVDFAKKVYYLLNKPTGYTCSHKRIGKKAIVYDLFDKSEGRLFTAGRLDRDTSGLIIVTNDGDFSQKIIHPSSNIQKEYVVKTNQEIMPKDLKRLMEGTKVQGTLVKPVAVKKVRKGTLKIVVMEGKKHEVREIVAAAGMKVLELKRVRIGGLTLGSLPVGAWRPLTKGEMEQIFA